MASITERKNKDGKITSYQISVTLGRDDEGRKVRRTTSFTPKATAPTKARKEAEQFAVLYEKQIKDGTLCVDAEKVTFKDLSQLWDDQYLAVRVRSGDMTQKCREDYKRALRLYGEPALKNKTLSEINAVHIDKIVNDMIKSGKSPKTIRSTFNVFNAMFQYAYRKRIINENPCARCNPLPKIRKSGELHTFTEDQVKRFLNDALNLEHEYQIGGHTRKYTCYNGTGEAFKVKPYTEKRSVSFQFKVFFTLAVYTGCRRSELCALTWRDIDPDARTLSVNSGVTTSKEYGEQIKDPKTASGKRSMKLPAVCFDMLRALKTEQQKTCLMMGADWQGKRGKDFDDNYIFIQTNGKRMNVQSPTAKFKKILEAYNETVPDELKLPMIRLHDLRHTNASHLVASGVDIETVAKRLGHSKASFTLDVYGHAIEGMDDKASDTLEQLFAGA